MSEGPRVAEEPDVSGESIEWMWSDFLSAVHSSALAREPSSLSDQTPSRPPLNLSEFHVVVFGEHHHDRPAPQGCSNGGQRHPPPLSPRHGSFIAAILVNERHLHHWQVRNAIWLAVR